MKIIGKSNAGYLVEMSLAELAMIQGVLHKDAGLSSFPELGTTVDISPTYEALADNTTKVFDYYKYLKDTKANMTACLNQLNKIIENSEKLNDCFLEPAPNSGVASGGSRRKIQIEKVYKVT